MFPPALRTALLAIMVTIAVAACGPNASKGAAEGAAMGAASCAVGSVVGSLVFGGDVLDNAARSAVYCGAAGAFAGGVQGSSQDKKQQQAHEHDIARMKQLLGEDAFESLSALAQCDHEQALNWAQKAQKAQNPNYALSGLWLEVLIYADQQQESKARQLLPTVVDQDWDVDDLSGAELKMRQAIAELTEIRSEYELPQICV